MSGQRRLTARAYEGLVMVTFLGMKIILTPAQAREFGRQISSTANTAAAHDPKVPVWHD